MFSQLKNPRVYVMILADSAIFVMAFVGAYLLRFEFVLHPSDLQQIGKVLPYLIWSKLTIFFLFGLYKGMWRYSSIADGWRLGESSLVSTLWIMAIVLFIFRFQGFPRSVFLIDMVLTFLLAGGLRVAIRSYYAAQDNSKGVQTFSWPHFKSRHKALKRVLIIGAGGSGEKLLREIFDNPNLHYYVVGFLDDDPGKKGRAVRGIPVLGPAAKLSEIVESHGVQEVFISVPSATGEQKRLIIEICKRSGVKYKTLPAIGEIMDGKVSIKSLRDVNYEDLLGRPPVTLDMEGISNYVSDKTVLVTGCGGSIGSELCRQLVRFNPKRIILVDASEANLFHMQMELHHEIKYQEYHCVLGRVQHQSLMEEVFKEYRPEVVFHAAACKHVPMLENNPWEAIFNNVMGSKVVIALSAKYGIERFVLVSTDKAVRPTNVMGTAKRLTELILQSFQGNGTRFMAVRFGNVVGSSGSVVPLFRRQIEQGGPVTVTHPEVTRYFMTIPEAAQLILQAGSLGEGGEIFLLEMGTPVKIAEMARDMIRLSGKEPGKDIEIVFTGLRDGEKLYEELITAGENITKTGHEKIMVLRPDGYFHGLDSLESFREWLNDKLAELFDTAYNQKSGAIKEKLKEMVPEYTPQDTFSVF